MLVDDVHRRIVFHLAAPDPNFLYRLVYAAQATPADAPAAQAPTNAPIAGTGPYRIARYVEGAKLLLVRQPWFGQWSYAAQPAGYPEQIRVAGTLDIGGSSRCAGGPGGRAPVALPTRARRH